MVAIIFNNTRHSRRRGVDDDKSLSSTFSVDADVLKSVNPQIHFDENNDDEVSTFYDAVEEETAASSSGSHKRVRFCETRNEYFTNTRLRHEDYQKLCFTPRETHGFRSVSRGLVSKILQKDHCLNRQTARYKAIVERVYHTCCGLTDPSSEELPLPPLVRQELEACVQTCVSRGGLEGISIPSLAADRTDRRKKLTSQVKQIQILFADDRRTREVALRMASENITRPARIFARMMGEAASEPRIRQQGRTQHKKPPTTRLEL